MGKYSLVGLRFLVFRGHNLILLFVRFDPRGALIQVYVMRGFADLGFAVFRRRMIRRRMIRRRMAGLLFTVQLSAISLRSNCGSASQAFNWVYRRAGRSLRMAMARALRLPIMTSSRRALVMPVYTRLRCSIM